LSRVPIRLRLTATFALAMAVVLAAAGFLLYHHLAASLDHTLAQGLRARAGDISALVQQADTGLRDSRLNPGNPGFAQVLDAHGRIFDQTPALGQRLLLTREQLGRARQAPLIIGRGRRAGASVRLLATPVSAQGQRLVVVVGTPLDARDHALATLRNELLVGGPAALLLASLIGYLIAAAAFRPVERMRSRAAAISAHRLSERLPIAPSQDEIARLGETLNQMLGRLEAALERERSFVADASHELRTPLAHLRAEVELALESPREKHELENALRSVGDESDRLSQLAEDLLLLARLDKGTLPIRRDDIDLDELLGGMAVRFDRRAKQAGRSIATNGGGGRARVDRLRIEQALGNLIDNALRHGAGAIHVSAVQKGDWLELQVSDEGAGFSADFVPHAFERFSRADQHRNSGGTGLGLAIVAAVAQAHGGSAAVANRRRGGGDVSIRVPSPRETNTNPTGSSSHTAGGRLTARRSPVVR
jgi:two-component system, OmpR family, sensor kinase